MNDRSIHVSSLVLFETFSLRAAPMKNRGTAHLNQFWCRFESKRVFFWGRDAVAVVDPGPVMAEGCMATNDARCASSGHERRRKEW